MNKYLILGIIAGLAALFLFFLLGQAGALTFIGAVLFFIIPFYLILDNTDLETGEQLIFSFFIGIGVFSGLVYYLGIVFNSIRIAIPVTWVILAGIGIAWRFRRQKKTPAPRSPGPLQGSSSQSNQEQPSAHDHQA
ncbi:MAG: hypothetical protein ABIH34_05585 [Nanoarchaeota archaeon]